MSLIIENAQQKLKYTDWMKQRVDSEKGKEIYSHRMSVVGTYCFCISCVPAVHGDQPVFGNITSNKGLNKFTLRTKKKVQAQWQFDKKYRKAKELRRIRP